MVVADFARAVVSANRLVARPSLDEEDVRKQGPWQGQRSGDVDKLKPEYRLALDRDGYALVKCEHR